MKHLSKTLLVVAVMLVLVGGSVRSVFAQTPPPAATSAEVHGTVTALNSAGTPPTVTITPATGAAVTVKVVTATKVEKQGVANATLSDLAIDDRAVAVYDKATLEAGRISARFPLAKHRGVDGTVRSIGAASLVVTEKKSTTDTTITVNDQTSYNVPGVKDAKLANFKVADRVAILAVDVKGTLTALRVTLIPGKPEHAQRVGSITSYTAGSSITITGKNGDTTIFAINGDTKIQFRRGAIGVTVGDDGTVTARRDPSSDSYTAMLIMDFGAKTIGKPDDKGKPTDPGKPAGSNTPGAATPNPTPSSAPSANAALAAKLSIIAWAVGQQASYNITSTQGVSTITYSLVGNEGEDWWVETKIEMGGQVTISKMLVNDYAHGGATMSIKRLIVQTPGQPPFEMPTSMFQQAMASAQTTSEAQVNSNILGTESKTVKAGTFTAIHAKTTVNNSTSDGYFSGNVPVIGMVFVTATSASGTTTLELISTRTSGAVSEITGTPQQFPSIPGGMPTLPPGTNIPGR